MKWAYYNEHDQFAAAWLRNLIAAGVIAPGEVDGRDIQLVTADDLRGFVQCHFFAGIGVWSYALRQAGWPDDKPAWTGSCPCQPFSVSGKRAGASDGRHLWPVWFPLIRESRPELVFGEQVASDDGLAWLDLVSSDLEGQGYTVGAVDTCAAGFGAPHIRQRLYFCADTESGRQQQLAHSSRQSASLLHAAVESTERLQPIGGHGTGERESCTVTNSADTRRNDAREHGSRPSLLPARPEQCSSTGLSSHSEHLGHHRPQGTAAVTDCDQPGIGIPDRDRAAGELRDSDNGGLPMHRRTPGNGGHTERAIEAGEPTDAPGENAGDGELQRSGFERLRAEDGSDYRDARIGQRDQGPTNGFWANCDWWYGRDGKYRPIESGLQPLAHGATNRVGRLRGYGNAIVAEQAKGFIRAYLVAEALIRT